MCLSSGERRRETSSSFENHVRGHRDFGDREAQECHAEIRVIALCQQHKFPPTPRARRPPSAQRCGAQVPVRIFRNALRNLGPANLALSLLRRSSEIFGFEAGLWCRCPQGQLSDDGPKLNMGIGRARSPKWGSATKLAGIGLTRCRFARETRGATRTT